MPNPMRAPRHPASSGPLFLCGSTRKRIYPSEAAAQSVINGWIGPFGPDRAYICPDCEGWHLTSQPLSEVEIPECEWRVSMAIDSTAGKKRKVTLARAMARADPTSHLIFGCKALDDLVVTATPIGDRPKEALLALASDLASRLGLHVERAEFPLLPSPQLLQLTGFIRNPGDK